LELRPEWLPQPGGFARWDQGSLWGRRLPVKTGSGQPLRSEAGIFSSENYNGKAHCEVI